MTRRALYLCSIRVIRGRGGASFNLLNDILVIFRVSFSYFEMFYAFVLQFWIFLIKFEWLDEDMQSESFQGRLDDQNIASSKSTFWWHMSVIIDEFLRFDSFSLKFPDISLWEMRVLRIRSRHILALDWQWQYWGLSSVLSDFLGFNSI